MSKWTYQSSGGENYPVAPGDTWAVGSHILMCADLEDGAGLALLDLTGDPDVVYVDPPWNAGLARGFRTKAGVDGDAGGRKVDVWGSLHARIFDVCARARLGAWVEGSLVHKAEILAAASKAGARLWKEWEITYYQTSPAYLAHFLWHSAPDAMPPDLAGQDDEDTPRIALQWMMAIGALLPGQLVIDPCTGLGLTGTTAASLGLRFAGTELSPFRMSGALTALAKATGLEPQRI